MIEPHVSNCATPLSALITPINIRKKMPNPTQSVLPRSRPSTPTDQPTTTPNPYYAPQRPAKFAHPHAQVQPFPILPTS